MDEDYLRKIRHWLRADFMLSGKALDALGDAGAETEISPLIPSPRTPPE